MASKNKHQELRTKAAAGSLAHEVEQLLEKGRFKDAVKQAKLCVKEAATPETHHLLERAYLLRANQLRQDGMPTAALEVAEHLCHFGITDPALLEPAGRLLLSLGLIREFQALQGLTNSPEAREQFERQTADLVVTHPERATQVAPELREAGQAVRAAIAAVQAGDEAQGLALVRDIARSSSFADWKLFVRGLAAHGRQDHAEAQANWDRLNPQRAAAQIVRGLHALSLAPGPHTEALELAVFGVAVLHPFQEFQALVAKNRWPEALKRIAPLRQLLAKVDPALPERLTQALYEPLINVLKSDEYNGDADKLAKTFFKVTEPLREDPHWNRFWALFWEQEGCDAAPGYWRRYLEDLKTVAGLKPEERLLAQALVLNRLGKDLVGYLEDMIDCPCPRDHTREREFKTKKASAIADFEASLKLAPQHLPTYHLLMSLYDLCHQPDQVLAVSRRLLEHFPEDFEALTRLAKHHQAQQQGDEALEYARRARVVKPLDPNALYLEWAALLTRARNLALNKQWDEGRAALQEAQRLRPETASMRFIRATEVVLEHKAGQTEHAQALLQALLTTVPEPAPVWLALCIEAVRYKLPRTQVNEFKKYWTEELNKKPTGETAGTLATLIGSYLSAGVEYTGRAAHVKDVMAYLHRAENVKYTQADLTAVCDVLELVPNQQRFRKKMLERAIKLFPKEAQFRLYMALQELDAKRNLSWESKNDIRKHLKVAQQLVEASQDPNKIALQAKIREAFSILNQRNSIFGESFLNEPQSGFGPDKSDFASVFQAMQQMFGGFDLDEDEDWGDDDDDDWGDDDDDEEVTPLPSRPKIGRKLPPQRKKGR